MEKGQSYRQMQLTKEEFVDIMNRLKESKELVDKVNELFYNSRENIECDFCNAAGMQISHEIVVVRLLEKLMHDESEVISYFIYELDYGKECKLGCVINNERDIDLSTAEKLYEYLAAE